MGAELPVEIQNFITRHIHSVEQLEVLLLLQKSGERVWTPAELGRELRGNEAAIGRWLDMLVATGLVCRDGPGYRLRADSPEAGAELNLVAALYRQRMVKVIEFIYQRPNPQLTDFTEAFKFRRKQ